MEKKLETWLKSNVGDFYNDLCLILKNTGSYVAGNSLYYALQTNDLTKGIEIFATAEAAELILTTLFDRGISLARLDATFALSTDFAILAKNGIAAVFNASSQMAISICQDPYWTIHHLPINHSHVYFDGQVLNTDVLKQYPRLLDAYVNQREQPYVKDQIQFFFDIKGYVWYSMFMSKLALQRALLWNQVDSWDSFDNKMIVQQLYENILRDMTKDYPVLHYKAALDSMLYEYTFGELVRNLTRVKRFFLAESYHDDVMKLIENKILELHSASDLKAYIEEFYETHTGKDFSQIEYTDLRDNSYQFKNQLLSTALHLISISRDKLDHFRMLSLSTRQTANLEFFTKPSAEPVPELAFDEQAHERCFDNISLSYYDINAYLNGEPVRVYADEDSKEEEEVMEAVPPEVARKRLVFFVANEELTVIKPYCYSLDKLEKDIGSRLYSDTCTPSGGRQHLDRGFSNPLFKIELGYYPVFVRLSKLLKALYKTKSQAFLLIPTQEVAERTASLGYHRYQLGIGADHCQPGTNKTVYRIVACGRGSDKCYPLREDLQLVPDSAITSRSSDFDYGLHENRYDMEIQANRLDQELLIGEDD